MRNLICQLFQKILLLGIIYVGSIGCLLAQYSGGIGTADNPYQIATATDLVKLSQTPADWQGKSFVLTADIDMSGQTFTPIGSTANVFTGTFDGRKHIISNLTVTPVLVDNFARSGTGLFGAFSGTLSDLGIINIQIDVSAYANSSRVGAFVGELIGGSIERCFVEGGTVSAGNGGWTGGIVGALFYGGTKSVEDCYSAVNVVASWGSGGVVGANRGAHKINRVAFYGTITKNQPAITTVQVGTPGQKEGIPPTNAVYRTDQGVSDANATGLDAAALLQETSYPTFDFSTVWRIDSIKGFAVLKEEIYTPELSFFERLRTERVQSDTTVIWKNFGPGMSGYCEEFWCHPTDTNVMFMGPDMHVSYGTWDNGKSWHTIKDYDGDGLDLERVNDMAFSLQNPDYGVAIERRGKIFETHDRGRSWKLIYLIPHAAESPWYNAHSRIAIDPQNDSIWYIGAGGFWDVKGNFRSAASPYGTPISLYAYGYILKTTDRGKTWKKIATEISDKLDVGRILINPMNSNRIVIATGQGMFASDDAGENWHPANTGLPNNLPKDLCAYYNPDTKEYILYTVEQSVYTESGNTIATRGGVFKSTDGGESWIDITGNLGLDFTQITEPGFRDNYAKAVAFWLGKSKSEIAAKAYPTFTLPVFRRMVVNPLNKQEIYLVPNQRHDKSFGPGDVLKTEDGGITWKIVTRHGRYWHKGQDTAYWQSKGMETTPNVDFSHMQATLDQDLETASANRMLAINAKGQVFIGINQQTLRSNDGGKSWHQIDDYETQPGSNAWVGRGDSNLPGRFMLHYTGIPDRRLFCSGEHGLWQTAPLGDYPDKDAVAVTQIEGQVHDVDGNHGAHSISTVAVHPNDPNTIFILAWRQEHRGWLRKTTDGGKTWFNVVQLFDSDNALWEETASQNSLLIDPVNPQYMYFTATYKPISCGTNSGPGPNLTLGEYGVHRSTDGGNTWQVMNNGFPEGASVNRIILDPDNPQVLYAALNQWGTNDPYGLYKSTDRAQTWTKMNIPSKIRSVNNVFIDKNTKYIYISCGSRTGVYDAGGVYRSKDHGETWELIFEAPYVWYAETSPVNPNKILVDAAGQVGGAFKNPGLYLSTDDGKTWRKINRGIGQPDKMVDIELDPYNENILWTAGWGSGWFKAILPYDGVKAVIDKTGYEVDEGSSLTLYGMGSLGSQLEYQWVAPAGIQLNSSNEYKTSFTAPMVDRDTLLTFQLIVKNNEASDTTDVQVKVRNRFATSARAIQKSSLRVFPNPVTGNKLYVQGVESGARYALADLRGSIVQNGFLTSGELDVSSLVRGIYILNVFFGGEAVTEKIVRN